METPHRPAFAATESTTGPRRALILAGGGMRVSWQAGALEVLAARGMQFTHADGTSGGIMNLGALLSGVPVEQLCDRWRTLEPRQFSSFAPLEEYLRLSGPIAFGDSS